MFDVVVALPLKKQICNLGMFLDLQLIAVETNRFAQDGSDQSVLVTVITACMQLSNLVALHFEYCFVWSNLWKVSRSFSWYKMWQRGYPLIERELMFLLKQNKTKNLFCLPFIYCLQFKTFKDLNTPGLDYLKNYKFITRVQMPPITMGRI